MLNISKRLAALNENQVRWLFTALAALLAWRVIYIQHGWINDDSVLYFEVARLFSIGEWKQGLTLYNWPLYPAIISCIHQFTGFEFQRAAQILDVAFFALTTYSFITLIRLAGGNQRTVACGTLLLFSTLYIVGDVLPMLLRDQGFWAFFLTSLIFFIQFYRDKKLQTALFWQISAIIAVLFRVEAITFLLFLPLILLAEKNANRTKNWIVANTISLFIIALISIALLSKPSASLAYFGRLNEIPNLLHLNLTHHSISAEKLQWLDKLMFGSHLRNYGATGIIFTLIISLCIKCIAAPGWFATLILAGNWKHFGAQILPDSRKIFYWVIGLAILNAAIIIFSTFILSGRYVVSLGFILLIFAAFSLATFVSIANKSCLQKIILVGLFLLMTLSLIKNILPKKEGYNFEQEAVAYVQKLKSPSERVFYVSPRARYYAGEPFTTRGYDFDEYTAKAIADGSIETYDYLAININSNSEKEVKLVKELSNYVLIKEVMGPRAKKKVMLFARRK